MDILLAILLISFIIHAFSIVPFITFYITTKFSKTRRLLRLIKDELLSIFAPKPELQKVGD